MPKISVVIPLYNKEKHIGRTINSVLSQTFDDFEVVVVNDGSTDGSANVVRGIKDARIRLLGQDNAGETAARNTGIRNARAEICAFLDADDAWEPKFLETILELRDKYPRAGAYATARKVRTMGGIEKHLRFVGIPESPWSGIIPNYFRTATLGPPPVWSSAVAIPKSTFYSAGFFPEGEKIGGDQDMWLRIALKHKIAFSNYLGAIYFMDADNRVCNRYKNLYKYALVESAEKALEKGCVPGEFRNDLLELANKRKIKLAENCVLAGRPELARKHLSTCKTRRFFLRKMWWMFWSHMPYGNSFRIALTNVIRKIKRSVRNIQNMFFALRKKIKL